MFEQTVREELAELEEEFYGHTDNLESNFQEIKSFSEDPMFNCLTDAEKETLKHNLVYFMKQVR